MGTTNSGGVQVARQEWPDDGSSLEVRSHGPGNLDIEIFRDGESLHLCTEIAAGFAVPLARVAEYALVDWDGMRPRGEDLSWLQASTHVSEEREVEFTAGNDSILLLFDLSPTFIHDCRLPEDERSFFDADNFSREFVAALGAVARHACPTDLLPLLGVTS